MRKLKPREMELIAQGHPMSHDRVTAISYSQCNDIVTRPHNRRKKHTACAHTRTHTLSLFLPLCLIHSELQRTYKDNWSHILCAEFLLVPTGKDPTIFKFTSILWLQMTLHKSIHTWKQFKQIYIILYHHITLKKNTWEAKTEFLFTGSLHKCPPQQWLG